MQLCGEMVARHRDQLLDALVPTIETARMQREDMASLQAECVTVVAGGDQCREGYAAESVRYIYRSSSNTICMQIPVPYTKMARRLI